MAETAQYLTLGLAGETFGISIRNVREILDIRPISRLPHAPHFLLGMIDVRGSGYPIVDLRLKLDLPSVPATDATRIIILDVPIEDRVIGGSGPAHRSSAARPVFFRRVITGAMSSAAGRNFPSR